MKQDLENYQINLTKNIYGSYIKRKYSVKSLSKRIPVVFNEHFAESN